MPDTPHPDPALLPALLERAAQKMPYAAWMGNDEQCYADAAALRAWAPLLVAAVQVAATEWTYRDMTHDVGWRGDYDRLAEVRLQHEEAMRDYRAALWSGAGEGERG